MKKKQIEVNVSYILLKLKTAEHNMVRIKHIMNPPRTSASFLLLYYITSERTNVVIIYSQAAKLDEDKPQYKPEHSLGETKEPKISTDQRSSPIIKQWSENKHRHLRKAT